MKKRDKMKMMGILILLLAVITVAITLILVSRLSKTAGKDQKEETFDRSVSGMLSNAYSRPTGDPDSRVRRKSNFPIRSKEWHRKRNRFRCHLGIKQSYRQKYLLVRQPFLLLIYFPRYCSKICGSILFQFLSFTVSSAPVSSFFLSSASVRIRSIAAFASARFPCG